LILVDKRVGSADIAPLLPPGIARRTKLNFGDFCFHGLGPNGKKVRVGVERKRMVDFIYGIDRFLGHQLHGMLETYDYVYLVVEGLYKPRARHTEVLVGRRWKRFNFPGGRVHSILNSLAVVVGIIPWHTMYPQDTAKLLVDLWKWWQKPWPEHGRKVSLPRVHLPLEKPSLLLKIAAQLPGIGAVRAQAVAERFKTVVDMVNADQHEWQQIPGIGKVLGKNVWRSLRC